MDMQALFTRIGGLDPIGSDELSPMAETEITDVEKTIGSRLPETYRKFLATFGASALYGVSPDHPYVVFRSKSPIPPHITDNDKALFNALYGGKKDERDAYSLQVRMHYYAGRMPDSIIPIGDDGGAGQICLGVKGNEAGKVYYWDQANEPLDEEDYLEDYGVPRPPEAMFQNVYEIADSFEDFLQRLEIMEE